MIKIVILCVCINLVRAYKLCRFLDFRPDFGGNGESGDSVLRPTILALVILALRNWLAVGMIGVLFLRSYFIFFLSKRNKDVVLNCAATPDYDGAS